MNQLLKIGLLCFAVMAAKDSFAQNDKSNNSSSDKSKKNQTEQTTDPDASTERLVEETLAVEPIDPGGGGSTTEYFRDYDRDGLGDPNYMYPYARTGYVTNSNDCDDYNYNIRGKTYIYRDADGDGYGDPNTRIYSCPRSGYVSNNYDCDDRAEWIGKKAYYYYDADGDGIGAGSSSYRCPSAGYVLTGGDQCPNEAGPASNNGCPTCTKRTWYRDADGDGYGNPGVTQYTCNQPSGYVSNGNDCNDSNSNIRGKINQYRDADGDGYGNPAIKIFDCPKAGYVTNSNDCNDSNASIKGKGYHYYDADGDGLGAGPSLYTCLSAEYVSNNLDQCPNEAGPASNNGCPVASSNCTPGSISTDQNYILTLVPQTARTKSNLSDNPLQYQPEQVASSIQYFDGLGRPAQSIQFKASPTKKDLISFTEYDQLGRVAKEYLPYAGCSDNNLGFIDDPITEQLAFYNQSNTKHAQSTVPFAQKIFDGSPLNRVIEQGAPGSDWQIGTTHTIKSDIIINQANEVLQFNLSSSGALLKPVYWPQEQLLGSEIIDEHGFKTIEYKDKTLDRVYVKRVQNDKDTGKYWQDTYYVYNDLGQIAFVLPPMFLQEYVGYKSTGYENLPTANPSSTLIDQWAYQYKYDQRGRLVAKKLPGKQWEFIVYNEQDLPILTQDGELRKSNYWLFTKYDVYDRPVATGRITISPRSGSTLFDKRNTLQNEVTAFNSSRSHWETTANSASPIPGYTNNSYPNNSLPTSNMQVYSINYYDQYNNIYGTSSSVRAYLERSGFSGTTNITSSVKGQLVASKTAVLNQSGVPTHWTMLINFYDKYGRVKQSKHWNAIGQWDVTWNEYDFIGKVTKSHTESNKNLSPLYSVSIENKPQVSTVNQTKTFSYDHTGRLLNTSMQINNGPAQLLAANEYNELGELVTKKVGGSATQPLQTVDYRYNIRGWMTSINNPNSLGSDLFALNLTYNKNHGFVDNAQYNGNISGYEWRSALDNFTSNYAFRYDGTNRLTKAIYDDNSSPKHDFSVPKITYDRNGNIKTLQRNGWLASTYFGLMDNLTYTYNGNQLLSVYDSRTDLNSYNVEFKNNGTSSTAQDYWYDANGNMIKDLNKGISDIDYNHLNLPVQVVKGPKSIYWTYDATGQKVKKTTKTYGYLTNVKWYINGMEYASESSVTPQLEAIYHEQGRVTPLGAGWQYEYTLSDQLGNARVSFADKNGNGSISTASGDKEILQAQSYYPFGMTQSGIGMKSPEENLYQYNGKELQSELNWNHYGARFYDPAISRWFTVDPLAHVMPAWSPYSFVFNNPLSYIDPDGRIPYPITIRAFAPFKSFGLGFHGDNRGYSTGNVSARVHQKINFDTDKTSITTNAWSSPSWHAVNPNYKKTATPSVNFEGDFTIQKSGNAKTFNFGTHVAGGNPLTPGAPPIDVFSNFSITENKKAGTLDISGKLTGDNFPSTEAFITDPNGNNVFIGIGFYEGSPFSSLWGENKDNPITDFNFSITTDSDGNFTGINAAGKNYSISDWNKMFETADPHKNANKKSEQTPGERWGRPFE